jgi:hypothetical protein
MWLTQRMQARGLDRGAAHEIDGLTPGTTYMFQVRAIGGSTRYSDWSNPVSRVCV